MRPTNLAVLSGTLMRPATTRVLGDGGRAVELDLSVRADGRPAETVPVSWPDPPATPPEWEPGTALVVVGRVRRRFFRAGGATTSRTEVVATGVLPARQARRVGAVVRDAVARLQDSLA